MQNAGKLGICGFLIRSVFTDFNLWCFSEFIKYGRYDSLILLILLRKREKMAKQIEMNYKLESGYEVIYPQVQI